MAIIWKRSIDGNHYEVRTAGASVRLYRNGVNHSQWNPKRPLGGSIWDLIVLPTLHRPAGSLNDILILGFGAGAVGKQIQTLLSPDRIVGVDLDPIHLSIADGFFECNEGFDLIAGDAVEWVHAGADQGSYDVIIDDLYSELEGEPVRCVPTDVAWCEALCRLLKPGGILIFNMVEPSKVKHLPMFKSENLRQRYPATSIYRIDGYENRIVAFSEEPFDQDCLQQHLKRIRKEYPACGGVENRYVELRIRESTRSNVC